jgi:hypothetical protein
LPVEHPDPKPDIKPLQKDCHKVKIFYFETLKPLVYEDFFFKKQKCCHVKTSQSFGGKRSPKGKRKKKQIFSDEFPFLN